MSKIKNSLTLLVNPRTLLEEEEEVNLFGLDEMWKTASVMFHQAQASDQFLATTKGACFLNIHPQNPQRYNRNIVKTGIKKFNINSKIRSKQSWNIIIRHPRFFTASIYFIYNHIFSKKYFKAISGQIFMKLISRHAEFFEFYLFI